MDAQDRKDVAEEVRETAEAIAALHAAHRAGRSRVQAAVERLLTHLSMPAFLAVVTGLVGVWIAANELLPPFGYAAFDPRPYPLLVDLLTLFAVYVALAVLAGQRRLAELGELRSQVNLEHTILAERKASKMIALLEELRRDHPAIGDRRDREAEELAQPADPQQVVDAIVESREDASPQPTVPAK
jgi:uncharacterized membrane protein